MMSLTRRALALVSLAATALAWDTICAVKPLGGGRDDGPGINAAFEKCSSNAAIILDGYYSVNTLLLAQNLSHVDIVLSGTGKHESTSTCTIADWLLRKQSSILPTSRIGPRTACT